MKSESPQIELYMTSLEQEFSIDRSPASLEEWQSGTSKSQVAEDDRAPGTQRPLTWAADWDQQWLSKWADKWVYQKQGSTLSIEDEKLQPTFSRQSLEFLEWRKEDFGAVVFDRNLCRVYRVNHTGLELLEELCGVARKDRSSQNFRPEHFDENDTDSFITFLREAGYDL